MPVEQHGLADTGLVEFPIQEFVLLLQAVLTEERRHQADAVEVCRGLSAGQFRRGRQEIAKVTDLRRDSSCRNVPRSTNDQRYADAAVGHAPFVSADRAVGIEEIRIVLLAPFFVRTVVGRE